ncbi:MAG: FG-GAP repeat domain-containing protein [Aulosira sp. ZfuVER01]|nr:VCBS repeat-containing protein [Aulosira sp. ZfuVER01]MDZ8002174.1 VCBS repeat-containing protein [Aulosira sp. DedVER01a]MDZ8052559.1 VCBS repeat-containing protein [Aulosira sp. ZfuCHP01]
MSDKTLDTKSSLSAASLQVPSPFDQASNSFYSHSSSAQELTSEIPNTATNSVSAKSLFGGANPNPNPYLTSAAIVPDFNGDGKTDKIWVDAQTGETQVWLMDGTTVAAKGSLGKIDLASTVYKIGDFNGDNKTDFLLRNQVTGQNTIVLMDGTNVASLIPLDTLDSSWTPLIGDFDGDRKTDIFWRNTQTGQNAIWLVDGSNPGQVIKSGTMLDTVDPSWSPTMVDFDGNGITDVFWRGTTGENVAWFMNGTQVNASSLQSQDPSWNFTVGDFNGDMRSDFLWRNTTTGENKVWLTNSLIPNNVFFTEASLTTLDSNWTSSIADFNGDGKTDIFWRNQATGENTTWLMDGGSIVTQTFLAPSSTTAQATFGDFNNDGRTDIYWRDYGTGADEIWTTNADGTTVTRTPVADADKLSPVQVGEDGNPILGPDGVPLKKWMTF